MRLKFKNQQFQTDAARAVTDVFLDKTETNCTSSEITIMGQPLKAGPFLSSAQ